MSEVDSTKEMGVSGKVVGIFTSPRETFESIDQKPTWFIPFLIVVIISIVLQYFTMDIRMKDGIAMMEAREIPVEQIEARQSWMDGPMKYIGFAAVPVGVLIVWAIISGILLFGGNTVMGGESKFKKVFSVVAWSSLIGLVGEILKTFLILSKGTTRGVVTSLAILVPTPELGQSSFLHRLLSQFDLFSIWGMVLWIIGLSVVYRFTMKKSATLVISLWAIWVVISVAIGGIFSGMFGG